MKKKPFTIDYKRLAVVFTGSALALLVSVASVMHTPPESVLAETETTQLSRGLQSQCDRATEALAKCAAREDRCVHTMTLKELSCYKKRDERYTKCLGGAEIGFKKCVDNKESREKCDADRLKTEGRCGETHAKTLLKCEKSKQEYEKCAASAEKCPIKVKESFDERNGRKYDELCVRP